MFSLTLGININILNIDDKHSSNQKSEDSIRTFVYADLPEREKQKFMEFMINNNVEFVQDNESNYIATICIRVSVLYHKSQLFNIVINIHNE